MKDNAFANAVSFLLGPLWDLPPATNHAYRWGEPITLWVNKLGPYANPQESYTYHNTLPFCHHEERPTSRPRLLDSLQGYHAQPSGYPLVFGGSTSPPERADQSPELSIEASPLQTQKDDRNNKATMVIRQQCSQPLTAKQVDLFRHAIQNRWFYQWILDDLPLWGMVGELLPRRKIAPVVEVYNPKSKSSTNNDEPLQEMYPYLYTHRTLAITHNASHIFQVDLVSDATSLVEIKEGLTLTMELEIQWIRTNGHADSSLFETRIKRYLDHDYFYHPMHWLSTVNASIVMILLVGLLYLGFQKTISSKNLAQCATRGGNLNQQHQEASLLVPNKKKILKCCATSSGQPDLVAEMDDNSKRNKASAVEEETEHTKLLALRDQVFQMPTNFLPLLALIGMGWQLATVGCILAVYACVVSSFSFAFVEHRDMLWSTGLLVYPLGSLVAGYATTRIFLLYHQESGDAKESDCPTDTLDEETNQLDVQEDHESEHTRLSTPLVALSPPTSSASSSSLPPVLLYKLLPCTALGIPMWTAIMLASINVVSSQYRTLYAIPWSTGMHGLVVWLVVLVFPFVPMGAWFAKCRHAQVGRKFPVNQSDSNSILQVSSQPHTSSDNNRKRPWYGKTKFLILLTGLLNFGCITVETSYIMQSAWMYKYYIAYDFLLGISIILVIVVAATSNMAVFLSLNAKNWEWQWVAFMSGASTGLYLWVYGLYYFVNKTAMNGLVQTSYYFGYMTMCSMLMATMCGAWGHGSAHFFVKALYENIKDD